MGYIFGRQAGMSRRSPAFVRFALMFECRGQPDSWLPSFASPKERNPRKGDPVPPPSASLRVPCVARRAGRLRNSRYALRQSSPTSPGSAPLLGGGKGEPPKATSKATSKPCPGKARTDQKHCHAQARDFAFSGIPFCAASVCRSNWDEGEHCLSSAAACVLCKLLGRVAQPPNLTGKPKVPRRGGAAGSPFLWYLSFGEAKERYQPPGCPRQVNQLCVQRTPNATNLDLTPAFCAACWHPIRRCVPPSQHWRRCLWLCRHWWKLPPQMMHRSTVPRRIT